MSWDSFVMAFLTAALVRPFALAAAGWLVLRIMRIRHPASEHAVWTAVLIGVLLLPVFSVLAPHWNLPVLPWARDSAAHSPTVQARFPAISTPVTKLQTNQEVGNRMDLLSSAEPVLLSCYAAGLFAIAAYRLMGFLLLRRLIARSTPLRGCVRESADLVTPVTVGVLRPAIIFPVEWRQWNARTKQAVLAHEFAHLRRHDPVTSALARFVQLLFWFHPLVWWLSGRISAAAEMACDAVALEKRCDPAVYSRMLLDFATAVNTARRRVVLPGLAMAQPSRIGCRVDRIFELSGGKARKLSRPGGLLLFVGVPAICIAACIGFGAAGTAIAQAQIQPPSERAPIPRIYLKWLSEDVAYIITDGERFAFQQLTTDEERDRFIAQFWERRNPRPGAAVNDFKQEHYRRIAYANEHFGYTRVAGWRSDRGRVYIMNGPPDEIESHPAGGAYERPAAEGGGFIDTFAFERWRYRHFAGIGSLTIEFVDPASTGEYRLTLDANEKDTARSKQRGR